MLSQACVECCPVGSDGCPIQCQLPMRCRSADTFRRQVWVIGCPIRCRFADTAHIFGAQHNFWCTARYKKKQWVYSCRPMGSIRPISPSVFQIIIPSAPPFCFISAQSTFVFVVYLCCPSVSHNGPHPRLAARPRFAAAGEGAACCGVLLHLGHRPWVGARRH